MTKKRPARHTQLTDENQFASVILDLVTDEKPTKEVEPKNPKSVAAGRKGGVKGGKATSAQHPGGVVLQNIASKARA